MVVKELDPILFEILRHRIEEIVAEAYHTVVRCSGNSILTEAGDHQEALLDANGNLIMCSGGVIHWVFSLEAAGKYLVKTYESNPGIYDGDHFVFNDTYIGAIHHPDVQVLTPVFWNGKRVAWIVTAGHIMDIGGMEPGGLMSSAEEVVQEGLRLPGIKLFESGVKRKDIENTLKGMTRQPDLFMLEVAARVAANNAGAKALKETIEKYGIDVVLALFRELQNYSEQLAKAKLKKIPDGTWRTIRYMESAREDEPYLKVKLTATKEGDELTLDFTGSSPQSHGSQNISKPGTISTTLCPYLMMLGYDIPWTSGLWRPIKWIIPEETIVNPRFPAAVSTDCPTGAGLLVVAAVQDILGQMLLASKEFEKEVCACFGAGLHSCVMTGIDSVGEYFVTMSMDSLICGMGALTYRDGDDACANIWTPKAQVTNIELAEELFPFLYLWRSEVIDTGGAGVFRGGVANVAARILWGTDSADMCDQGCGQEIRMVAGLAGGYPSPNTLQMVIRNSNIMEKLKRGELPQDVEDIEGRREVIPPFRHFTIYPGDVYIQYQSGGGGFGDPIERAPQLVAKDVKLGYVSLKAAKELYGVIIDPETLEVDTQKTERQRQAIISERLEVGRK